MDKLSPRKPENGPNVVPITDRLAVLLDVFSPWDGISLTYRQFAAEIGGPVTVAAVKKWPNRKKFPADVARSIVAKAKERGLTGVTLEWVMWGEGSGPKGRVPEAAPHGANEITLGSEKVPQDHRQLAARIAEALRTDLDHNEFGQWSSVEVQHTVLWSLKDLARRLWALKFAMGETFKLTDVWAAKVGLPVRPPEPPVSEGEIRKQQADYRPAGKVL